MLDLKFVRENPDVVKQNIKNKFQDDKLPLVDEVIELDAQRRATQQEADALRAEKNKISKQIGALMAQGKKDEAENVKKKVAEDAARLEELSVKEKELDEKVTKIMMVIPNIIDPSVPIGKNDTELLIVTNNHVVKDTVSLKITFVDDTAVDAAVKGTDADTDLAVISIPIDQIPQETQDKIAVARLGDSDSLKVGQGVIAIGNALGYGQSVTVGYVSALNREVQTSDGNTRVLLQTDAAINPGNSGGALLNMKGEVIGINAAKYSSTEVEGIGYAIPVSGVQEILDELMNRKTRSEVEESRRGYLGIQGTTVDEETAATFDMPKGVYVYKILEDGAAAGSELREKDIITKLDGMTVKSMQELQKFLKGYEMGETIELLVQRQEEGRYKEQQIQITLAGLPEGEGQQEKQDNREQPGETAPSRREDSNSWSFPGNGFPWGRMW